MDCFLSSFSLIFLSCIKNALSRVCKKANDSTDRLISILYRHWSVNHWLIWSFNQVLCVFHNSLKGDVEPDWSLWYAVSSSMSWMIGMVVVIDVQVNPLTWKCKCKVDAGFPLFAFVCHRWDGILSAVSAPFTAFLEPITRLSPPHQPWVSTHWRTVKNLLSLSCISQEGVHLKECFHFQGCFVCIRYACKAARARLWCIVVEVICWSWTERGNHCKDAIA